MKKSLLYCIVAIVVNSSSVAIAKALQKKQLTIIAQQDYLHDHESNCLLKLDPIGTVVTPNDMDENGNIILDENRNSATVHIQTPKDDTISLHVNFECNCFTSTYKISYKDLANSDNFITLNDDKTSISKPLIGKNTYKEDCLKNKQRISKNSQDIRPGAVIGKQKTRTMTIQDILEKYQNSHQILQALTEEGYNQSNLTLKDLELPGKLSKQQVRYIMERLPLDKNFIS